MTGQPQKVYRVTITITASEVQELGKFLFYKKATGNYLPEIDPCDYWATRLLEGAANEQKSDTDREEKI